MAVWKRAVMFIAFMAVTTANTILSEFASSELRWALWGVFLGMGLLTCLEAIADKVNAARGA